MSNVEKIRAIKAAKGAESYGQYVPFSVGPDAILELADRLDRLEADPTGALSALRLYKFDPAIPPPSLGPLLSSPSKGQRAPKTERPPQPFRLTGPGMYRQRNGRIATVKERTAYTSFLWSGTDGNGRGSMWREDGSWLGCEQSESDLVSSVNESSEAATQGWMNVHRNQSMLQGGVIYLTREEADAAPGAKDRADCVEVSVAGDVRPSAASVMWKSLHEPLQDQIDWSRPVVTDGDPALPCTVVHRFPGGDRLVIVDVGLEIAVRVQSNGFVLDKPGTVAPWARNAAVKRLKNQEAPF